MFLCIRCLDLFLLSRFGSLSQLKDAIVSGVKIQMLYQEQLVGRKNLSLTDLIVVTFLRRTNIQDYLVEEELRLCLEAEERMRLEHEKNIIEELSFMVKEAKRMKLEEEKLLQISHTLTVGSMICGHGRPNNANYGHVAMAYSASSGSSKKVVPKYVKFMVLEKISECKRTINFIVGEVQNATSHLEHLNGISAFTCDRDIFPSCLNWILSSIPENIWALFYCLPNTPLEKGLKLIHTDNDVLSFFAEAEQEDTSLRCSSSSPFSTRIKRKSHKTTKDCGRKNSRGKEKMVDDEPLGRKLLKTSRTGKEKMDELDEFPDLTPTKEREVDDDVPSEGVNNCEDEDASDEEVKSKVKSHEKRKLDASAMSPHELKYEGLSLDGPIDVGGPTTWCDLVHECVVENGDSLPIMDKECFSNNVVLDDVVPANRKSKTFSLRKGCGKRVACGANTRRLGGLMGLNVQTFRARKGWGKELHVETILESWVV
ncbi:hypothetical protein Tco_0173896 [Tanacetum coccineum]